MVRLEAGRVFDHAHPNIPCFKCAPEGCPCFTPVFDRGKLAPIGDCKREALDIHDCHVRKSHIGHINPTSSSQEQRRVVKGFFSLTRHVRVHGHIDGGACSQAMAGTKNCQGILVVRTHAPHTSNLKGLLLCANAKGVKVVRHYKIGWVLVPWLPLMKWSRGEFVRFCEM